jgi:hypothetical protein
LQLFFLYKTYLVLNRIVSETNPSESVRTVLESIVSACPLFLVFRFCVPLLTLLLYHKSGSLSRGFEKFLTIYFTLELCEVLRITHLFYQFTILVLLTLLLYHTIGKMSSGNVAQTFSGKMVRSIQNAQNGSRLALASRQAVM